MLNIKYIIMRNFIAFFLLFTAANSHSQTGNLSNIQVSQRTDGSGFVDIFFSLSGSAAAYNISLEASFDAGNSYQPVPLAYLSGDVNGISPGNNKHILWDGFASFPNAYSVQSKLKISATSLAEGGIPGEGVTDIDNNFYPTVIIGNQEWMAENLRVTRDAEGNNITRYCYANNTTNCTLYGGLYTWYTTMNGQSSSSGNPSGVQGICPIGWHVPSDAEWTELLNYVVEQGFPNTDISDRAGNALKSCRQVGTPLGGDCNTIDHPRWNSHHIHHGFDELGFAALPSGFRNFFGNFSNLGSMGIWWSSTDGLFTGAWFRSMFQDSGIVLPYYYDKSNAYGLRCVRD